MQHRYINFITSYHTLQYCPYNDYGKNNFIKSDRELFCYALFVYNLNVSILKHNVNPMGWLTWEGVMLFMAW